MFLVLRILCQVFKVLIYNGLINSLVFLSHIDSAKLCQYDSCGVIFVFACYRHVILLYD